MMKIGILLFAIILNSSEAKKKHRHHKKHRKAVGEVNDQY